MAVKYAVHDALLADNDAPDAVAQSLKIIAESLGFAWSCAVRTWFSGLDELTNEGLRFGQAGENSRRADAGVFVARLVGSGRVRCSQ